MKFGHLVITGATSGIGKAYAAELAERGFKKFILISRNNNKLKSVSQFLCKYVRFTSSQGRSQRARGSRRLGLRPRPLLNGVWGAAPAGFAAEPQLPAYMIQSIQPVWSAVESSNLSEYSLAGGL